MCNKYKTPDQLEIERSWHLDHHAPLKWPSEVFPRAPGPFLRATNGQPPHLIIGTWGLIPDWSETPKLKYATNNCRAEEAEGKPTFKLPWRHGQRCIIPAASFDEPCWETGRNVWWRFSRADERPWGLAGLWNAWPDKKTGELVESYTMLTVNADAHPLMSRMHKPDPRLSQSQQDKRSVVAIEREDFERWLQGTVEEVAGLIRPPGVELIEAGPVG